MTQPEPPSDQPPASSPQPAPSPAAQSHTPAPQRQMKLVNLLIIAFIAYATYHYFTDPKGDNASQGSVSLQQEDSKKTGDYRGDASAMIPATHAEDPRMDRLLTQEQFNTLKSIFPRIRSGVAARTLVQGEGRAAFCGQTVTYNLRQPGEQVAKMITGKLAAPTDRLSQSLIWGMEGMRIGEKREIRLAEKASVSLLADNTIPKDIAAYTVELTAATPEMPKTGAMPLRRFLVKGDAGYDFRCGDEALFHLTLHDATGKLLFTSLGGDPLFTSIGIGKGIPVGLEMALREMGPGGEYTLIIPPELTMPLYSDAAAPAAPAALKTQPYPADLLAPQQHVLIADIQIPRELYPTEESAK